jgi:hypothetical protein
MDIVSIEHFPAETNSFENRRAFAKSQLGLYTTI